MYVKLISLEVRALYGNFNYSVNFNPDVTFIYGTNGCGKTTILNITEAVITGQLYKLFNYTFKRIVLKYASITPTESDNYIDITPVPSGLNVVFNNEKYLFVQKNFHEMPQNSPRSIRSFYFSHYSFLREIKETFNYVYLPLNRSTTVRDDDSESYASRRTLYLDENSELPFRRSKDITMARVEELIHIKNSEINSKIAEINDKFRNNILKSLLQVDHFRSIDELFRSIIGDKKSLSTLQNTKRSYIKMLKELGIVTPEEETGYSRFFDTLIEDFKEKKKQNSPDISIELLLKYQEISKIKELISLAEESEAQKANIRRPIELFQETINDFICDEIDEKEIKISPLGRIYFTTKYSNSPIPIQSLSSGEKQLITFFANLIFNVGKNSAGIFVVDEPELSLHLYWQKIFVDKAIEINNNIQMIFATHAPEIIGRRRTKMYKLEKQYTKGDD